MIYTKTTNGSAYLAIRLTLDELPLTDADIQNNQSRVQWKFELYETSDYGSWYAYNDLYAHLDLNGQRIGRWLVKWDFSPQGANSKTIAQGTFTCPHNSDGSKSMAYNAAFNSPLVSTTMGTATIAGSQVLTTIPRATTPTLSDESVDMGQSVTISTPRASDSFTHKLKYAFEGASGTIAENVATSHEWTPPVSLASRIPSKASSACVITCETYNGDVLIGTKTVQLTLNVPASVVPTASHVISEGVADVASKVGAYVQSKTRLKVVTTAQGVYGSTISTIVTNVENANYSGNDITTGIIMGSGNVLVKTTATDSRGRSAVVQTTVSILPYAPPKIDSASLQRCAPDGTLDPLGTHLKFALKASVSSLIVGTEKNSLRRKLSTKKSTDYSYTEKVNSLESGLTYDSYQVISGYEAEYVFDALMYVEDIFGVALAVGKVPTGKITMHWGDDFIAVGGFREHEGSGFEAKKPAYFDDGLYVKKRKVAYSTDFDISGNCNDIEDEWRLARGTTALNFPENNQYFYIHTVIHSSTAQKKQIAYKYNSETIYTRGSYGGTWRPWVKLSEDGHAHTGIASTSVAGDILTFANNAPIGFTPIAINPNTTNIPPGGYNYSSGFISKRASNTAHIYLFNHATGTIAVNTFLGSAWHGWRYDMASYGADSGYEKTSQGTIIQAGKLSYPASTSEVNLVFPLAFPNACIAVVVTPDHGSTTPTWASISATVSALTKSGCKVQMRATDNNQPSSVGRTVNYIAFGY